MITAWAANRAGLAHVTAAPLRARAWRLDEHREEPTN